MKFLHHVDPKALEAVDKSVNRICNSVDGLKEAALRLAGMVSRGTVILKWEVNDESD